ncbi:hypothetical protein CVE37_06510 [Pseudomonas syringae pv. actinidiae]|nr:hypothetical protein [Pseudomonas syringae pv. actinidiae]
MWRGAPKRGRRASRTACDAERRTIAVGALPDIDRSSRSSVGMPVVTLRVTNLCRAANFEVL